MSWSSIARICAWADMFFNEFVVAHGSPHTHMQYSSAVGLLAPKSLHKLTPRQEKYEDSSNTAG